MRVEYTAREGEMKKERDGMTIQVNAMGDACPIPVVKTRAAILSLGGAGSVETLVDNETAVENLRRLADSLHGAAEAVQLGAGEYRVTITVSGEKTAEDAPELACVSCAKPKTVVVLSSDKMGDGDDELGAALMKAFVYALGQQETLPTTVLCYNSGAFLTCEGAPSLEDLRAMEARGVEILTCGTCLNFYGLTEKLAVGSVTNMYAIVEKLTTADRLVRP